MIETVRSTAFVACLAVVTGLGSRTATAAEPELFAAEGGSKVFVIQKIADKSYKRHVPDRDTMKAFKFKMTDVRSVDEGVLEALPSKDPLPSFIERPKAVTVGTGGKVYLLSSDDKSFHVPNRDTLKRLGYDIDRVPAISQQKFNMYTAGTVLPALPALPEKK